MESMESMAFMEMNLDPSGSLAFLTSTRMLVTKLDSPIVNGRPAT